MGGFTGAPVWRPSSEHHTPQPALGAWVSEQLVLWVHSSHVPISSTLDNSPGLEPQWGWHWGGRLRGRQSERTQVSSLKHLQEPKSLQRLSFETPLWVPPSGRHGLSLQGETTLQTREGIIPTWPFTAGGVLVFYRIQTGYFF